MLRLIPITILFLIALSSRSIGQGCNCHNSYNYYGHSVAQQKSNIQAQQGTMRHLGGSFGSGSFEGVGFSTSSSQDAINRACSNGRPIREVGVAYGYNRQYKMYGWFATVIR